MRILLLKSLLLCTNCPSFLPVLCGILLFLPWICFYRGYLLFLPWICFCFCCEFVFAVESFWFLSWICSAVDAFCFCRGFVFVVDTFVYIPSFFLFFSFLPCSFYYLPRNPKNVGVFWEKVHRFSENLHRFLGLHSNF